VPKNGVTVARARRSGKKRRDDEPPAAASYFLPAERQESSWRRWFSIFVSIFAFLVSSRFRPEKSLSIFFVNFRRVFENLPGTLMKLKQKDSRPHVSE
jgi:hypothetical protein